MDCRDFDYYISLYIDKMLDEGDKEKLVNHLKECQRCSEGFRKTQQIVSMINSLESEPLPHDFNDKLLGKIGHGKRIASPHWLRWTGAVAGILVIFFSIKIALDVGVTDKASSTATLTEGMKGEDIADGSELMQMESPGEARDDLEADSAQYDGVEDSVEREGIGDGYDEEMVSKEDSQLNDLPRIQSNEVEIYVEDICITPETLKFIAIDNELELIESGEGFIVIGIHSQKERDILHRELSKLGEVREVGEEMDTDQVKLIIRAAE